MKLTGITVCLDEPCAIGGIVDSEYLGKCIQNKEQLDRWIIATSTYDIATIELCERHDLEFVAVEKTSLFSRERLLNEVLGSLDPDIWVVCLDVDLTLPENLKIVWNSKARDEASLYTISRIPASDYNAELAEEYYKEITTLDSGFHFDEEQSEKLFKSNFNKYLDAPVTEHLQIWNLSFQSQRSLDWLIFRKKFSNVEILNDCLVTYLRPVCLLWRFKGSKNWGILTDEQKIQYIKKRPEKFFKRAKFSGGGEKWNRLSAKSKIRYIRNNPKKILKYLI